MAARGSRSLAFLFGLWLAASPAVARADGESPKRADDLFTQANQLVEQGNYAEACTKYDESNRIDPGIGTQFKLADCYEHVNRPATALSLFRLVEKTAAAAGKTERQQAAAQRAQALEAKVSRLALTTPAGLKIDDYIVKCDGNLLTAADLSTKIPLDPGQHELIFAAPARLSRTVTFNLLPQEQKILAVPELVAPGSAVSELPPAGRTQRAIALAVGTVGIAGLAAGTVVGILSAHEHGVYTACKCVNTQSIGESQTAVTEGNVSTLAFVAGGVAVATGVTLWLTSPRRGRESATVGLEVVPVVGPRSASMAVRAAW